VDSARGGIAAREAPLLRHGRTDRRQRSLQLREDALRLGHRYDQRSDDQHSAVGRHFGNLTLLQRLSAAVAVSAHCSASCCPLLTPENILAVKISWTIGERAPGGPLLNTPMMRYQIPDST